jgi:DNA-binding Xre family transcriptional regulator
MQISIRLAQLLKPYLKRRGSERGFVAELARGTGVERHTIRALMSNKVTYVNLDSLAKICSYLIQENIVEQPDLLPGAIFARDPERFWELMTRCERLEFCLGTRRAREWPGSRYVMSTDSRLQGVMLARISQVASHSAGTGEPHGAGPAAAVSRRPYFSAFHLVNAPSRQSAAESPGPDWHEVLETSNEIYRNLRNYGQRCALIAMGSIKVNPVVERIHAGIVGAEPFQPDLPATAAERRFPIFFRYRQNDPRPPSFCGGLELARDRPAELQPGIWYESLDGSWQVAPWDENSHDAAFIAYVHRPNRGEVEVACGGFSSRATGLLTDHLDAIASQLRTPEKVADNLCVAIYVISFTGQPAQDHMRRWRATVHEVPAETIRRRLSSDESSDSLADPG